MRRAKFIGIGAEGQNTDVRVAGLVLGHGRDQGRVLQRHAHAAVRRGRLDKFDREQRPDHIVVLRLRADEIPERVGHERRGSVGRVKPFGPLGHMRVGADDKVNPLVGQPLGGLALGIGHGVAALHAPVAARDEHIAGRAQRRDLGGHRLAVVKVDDAVLAVGRRRQAVGALGPGEIADRDAVDGLGREVGGRVGEVIEPGGDDILRHRGPVFARGGDPARAFVVAVVV